MSLKCSYIGCAKFQLAKFNEIAFYQDLNTGGWNLALGPEFVLPAAIPSSIRLVDTGNLQLPYNAICSRCCNQVGKVNIICGFEEMTVNFSGKKTYLSSDSTDVRGKWSKIIVKFPTIRKITPKVRQNAPIIGSDTLHFSGVSDLEYLFNAGLAVSSKSNLTPRDYQWRSYLFASFKNTLLCLPTGMGKTLIANMLMKAYHKHNVNKGQAFIVPTVVLVEQQATAIERNIGIKVIRRSSAEVKREAWLPQEICVCTPAMLLNAIKYRTVAMSELSLLVCDEVHEANSPMSTYGLLLPYILQCPESQRPRVLGLTASPSVANSDIRENISSLCSKLGALPYTPLFEHNTEKPNTVTCKYISIDQTSFEVRYEKFVIDSIEGLSRLHNFFIANWKTISPNSPTQVKINSIVKILSHSKLVAEIMGDIHLSQLSRWMSKWIDSLDILQIFGPRRLMDFIRADLDYAMKNDALSKISSQLAPSLAHMRSTIEQMCDYEIAENTPKLKELLSLLKGHLKTEERILIFVERRNTAERLSRRLKEDPIIIKMNPICVMGNAGSGTGFKEMQQNVLEMFRKGECQLLVATSVLEQGIDVAMCGMVICFDGVKSIKSIIQSRGRARKDAAKFIAFIAAEKRLKANELSEMEATMDYTIRQLMVEHNCFFEPNINEEIQKFLESDRQAAEEINEECQDDDVEMDLCMPSDQKIIQLRFFHFVNSKALVDHIESCFTSQFDRVKITRSYIHAYFAVTDIETDSKIIKDISTVAERNTSLRSWIDVTDDTPILDIVREDGIECDSLIFELLTGFYFKDFTTVRYDSNLIWKENFNFEIRSNQIILSTGACDFRINLIDVDGPILIDDTKNSFEIFLCLLNPPNYFFNGQPAHFDFITRSFNLCLKRNTSIDSRLSWKLRDALQCFSTHVYNICHLKRAANSDLDEEVISDVFEKNYLIKAWHSMHAAVLPTVLPSTILKQFLCCTSITSLKVLLNNVTPVRFHKLEIKYIKDIQLPFPLNDLTSDDYAIIGRVKITPSRFIFLPKQPISINRVFRYFPDPNNFLLVSFTDEHSENPWRSTNICDWFLSVLQNGMTIGDKKFTFLGCSNSQLREGHCWFSSLDRDIVYNKIGYFPENWSAGRKLTRLALAFASSIQTVSLNHGKYLRNVAPDIVRGGITFSDGIGRASESLVETISTILNLKQKTSAFQIRVGGIKGVISVYDQDDDVLFRESMKKFESLHSTLEVLNYSRSIPLFLNRHVILLLSNYGVPDDVFLDLQHNTLMNCINTLNDAHESLSFVKSKSDVFDWHLFPPAHVVREPFFNQLLFSNVIDVITGVANHSHIPVSNGRVLMGVLDETNTLEYGEVYAHIVENEYEYEVEGRVVVFRNPCVLPSDIRVLNACKQSSLSKLKRLYENCLVIPSRGCNSHASECSGGDLDGDLYYVIWDVNLIPKLEVPGLPVIEIKCQEKYTLQITNSHESMIQFYCDYVSKNQLGIIANAHLASADQHGMLDPKTIELAKYVTVETDAPKKGFTVGKINPQLLPSKYPDFMQKTDKLSYRSNTVLGRLYHQSYSILEIFQQKRALLTPHGDINLSSDKKSIESLYSLYSFELRAILQSFDLHSEADLFSGTPMWREGYMSSYKQKQHLRQSVIKKSQSFWLRWKGIFDKWRSNHGNDEGRIREWYNRPKASQWPIHSFSFLAMPWVTFDAHVKKSLTEKIFDSSMRWLLYNKMRFLDNWRMRNAVGMTVIKKLCPIECHLYGSSMLGLNEEYSDMDILAADSNLDKIENALKSLDENVISMKKPNPCVSLTYESMTITVTNFLGGVIKTYALAETFDENPGYWPALRILIEWARTARIVKSCGSEGLMTVVSFCHLFIYFATKSPPRKKAALKPYTLPRFGNWIESLRNSSCGKLIYGFLKQLSCRSSQSWLMAKVDPLTGYLLIKEDFMEELSKNAKIAICILAVHDGDVQKLFEFCTKKRLFRLEKRYIDPITASQERKNQCLNELKATCNPKKCDKVYFELIERSGQFYVEVTGDQKYFYEAEKGINKIHSKIINSRTRSKFQLKTYHVVNSTIIISEFGNGPPTEISFSSYEGELFNALHTGIWKSKLIHRNVERNTNWMTDEFKRYNRHFLKQLQLFKEKQRSAKEHTMFSRFLDDITCNIRCGNHYFFNIPETMHNTFETISLGQIQEKIAHLEEILDLDKQEDIITDTENYNPLTLLQSQSESNKNNETLVLMPLHEVKMKSIEQTKIIPPVLSASKSKNLSGMRHSFYPNWSHGPNKMMEFAIKLGFKSLPFDADECHTNISVYWKHRELVVACDKLGMISKISHRSTRWLSVTLNRCRKDGGDDIRIYLECRAPLDKDETFLETVVEYLNGRSIYTETFAKQIHRSEETYSSRPLIPDIFHLNWRFRSMRVNTPVHTFVNDNKDIIVLKEIYDGIFQVDKHEFEWFPKHFELTIYLCMDNISEQELSRKSFAIATKLFDFTKANME